MKNKKEILISFLLGILFIYFLNYLPTLESVSKCELQGVIGGMLCNLSLENNLFGFNYTISVIAISLIIYKVKSLHITKRKDSLIVSTFISFIIIVGKAYTSSYTLYVLFSSVYNIIMTLVSFITYLIVFNYIFSWGFDKIEKIKFAKKECKSNKIINYIFYKDPFFTCSLIVFLVGIIYVLAFYIDSIILDNNWILLLFIVFTILVNAIVYGYVFHIMNKMNVNVVIRICSLAFFASPLIYIYSIAYYENAIYSLVFLFMITYQYYHFCYLNENHIKKYIILFIIMTFLLILNSSGFYVVIIDLLCLLFLKIKESNKNVVYFILSMIICTFGMNFFCDNSYETSDILTIPLGQTARYIKYYSQDINSEDEETLLKLFKVYDISEIGNAYDSNSLDDVKELFLSNVTKDDVVVYFKVWLKMFTNHPFSYFDATINSTYNYFYPDHSSIVEYIDELELTSSYSEIFEILRDLLYNFAKFTSNIPVISTIFTYGFHTIILLIIGIYLLCNSKKKIFLYLIPLYATLLIFMITQVKSFQSLLPIVISTPLIISIFLINIGSGGIHNER